MVSVMKIDTNLVNYLSRLARLKLADSEIQKMTDELTKILEYVEQLNQLDVTGVEPLVHTLEQYNIVRADENRPSLPREQVLYNAPDKDKGFFKVPKVIEEL
jgi:aspartyl-tRNA(Asn)/glutamyl-tRNA(Gln) amidotransferase subunit C